MTPPSSLIFLCIVFLVESVTQNCLVSYNWCFVVSALCLEGTHTEVSSARWSHRGWNMKRFAMAFFGITNGQLVWFCFRKSGANRKNKIILPILFKKTIIMVSHFVDTIGKGNSYTVVIFLLTDCLFAATAHFNSAFLVGNKNTIKRPELKKVLCNESGRSMDSCWLLASLPLFTLEFAWQDNGYKKTWLEGFCKGSTCKDVDWALHRCQCSATYSLTLTALVELREQEMKVKSVQWIENKLVSPKWQFWWMEEELLYFHVYYIKNNLYIYKKKT